MCLGMHQGRSQKDAGPAGCGSRYDCGNPDVRNSILSPLDFLAEFTQHIPPKGSHIIRYFGWYSNKSRGMRKKAEEAAETLSQGNACVLPPARCSQTWAMLIKRVYEIDPLVCSRCGGEMKIVSLCEAPHKFPMN
jgi:hypothetical protein